MLKNENSTKTNTEKLFLETFESLCCSRNSWQVWSDFITATACAIANSISQNDHNIEQHSKREKEYEECIQRLGGVEKAAKLFAYVVEALEENQEQDFLGNLFMKLNLGNHWKGQFFTPYNICKTMAMITVHDIEERVSQHGWTSVNDPACGAGATLIAMANILKEHNINYQNHTLFVAQDIDRIAGMMCYIQLSLLGCAGYIVIANTLSNPIVSKNSILIPQEREGQEFWYTPMFMSDIWECRRRFNIMDCFLNQIIS